MVLFHSWCFTASLFEILRVESRGRIYRAARGLREFTHVESSVRACARSLVPREEEEERKEDKGRRIGGSGGGGQEGNEEANTEEKDRGSSHRANGEETRGGRSASTKGQARGHVAIMKRCIRDRSTGPLRRRARPRRRRTVCARCPHWQLSIHRA